MKDDNKTKKQLVDELTELRSQNAALKKSITGSISAELVARRPVAMPKVLWKLFESPFWSWMLI
jgi:hypothetical protein